jgi:hypothetical protein
LSGFRRAGRGGRLRKRHQRLSPRPRPASGQIGQPAQRGRIKTGARYGVEWNRQPQRGGAGFISFSEMLKQRKDSAGHRQNLLMVGARRVGVASVGNPKSPYRKFWAMVITD